MSSKPVALPPDEHPCWEGSWQRPTPAQEFWTLAADQRTVNALPRLHPWRLSDSKGASRVLVWLGCADVFDPAGHPRTAIAALSQTTVPPHLPTDEHSWNAFAPSPGRNHVLGRWLSAYAHLDGSWLPPLAVLPRQLRDFDDPGTRWSTESADFAARHTVHADDTRYAADVLAPHVMALILDYVPDTAALTMAGDALHLWLPYTAQAQAHDGIALALVQVAQRVRDTIPSFVLTDYPDRSDLVAADLSAKATAAAAYRQERRLGRSTDPTLKRIYEQARANWESKAH